MRTYDELLQTENIADWTPEELVLVITTKLAQYENLSFQASQSQATNKISSLLNEVYDAYSQKANAELAAVIAAGNSINFEKVDNG